MKEKNIDIKKINEKINKESAIIDLLSMELGKVIVGQKEMIDRLLVALLSDGTHIVRGCSWSCKNTCD